MDCSRVSPYPFFELCYHGWLRVLPAPVRHVDHQWLVLQSWLETTPRQTLLSCYLSLYSIGLVIQALGAYRLGNTYGLTGRCHYRDNLMECIGNAHDPLPEWSFLAQEFKSSNARCESVAISRYAYRAANCSASVGCKCHAR